MSDYPIPADLQRLYDNAKRGRLPLDLQGEFLRLIRRIAQLEAVRAGLDGGLQVAATHADNLRERLERAESLLVLATTMPGCILDVDVADRIAAFLAESEVA